MGKIILRQMRHDDQDSFIDNWCDRQDSSMKKLARRARFFFKRFDTTCKILLQQIRHDGQDSLTKNIARRGRFFEKMSHFYITIPYPAGILKNF